MCFRIFVLMTFAILLLLNSNAYGEEINVSDTLTVTKLTDTVYIHTHDNSNGMMYIHNGEAMIISTPSSDEATRELLVWIKNYLKARVVGCVVDHWHPDAMEGVDVLKNESIPTYAFEKTRTIAKTKGLPIPDIGFNPELTLPVGNEKIVCRYFGEAHSADGIVVWCPVEQILYGGCAIKGSKGWVGNIAEANLNEWANTAKKIKQAYGNAQLVIPGHGKHGGVELIDYTIDLYKPNKWGKILRNHYVQQDRAFREYNNIFNIPSKNETTGEKTILQDAIVLVDDEERHIKIESSRIEIEADKQRIRSAYGRLQLFDKASEGQIPMTDLYYEELMIDLHQEGIGTVIILKDILR